MQRPVDPHDGPFHEGEIAVQTRAGVRQRVEAMGRRMIRDFMPEQHRELFAKLPTLVVGSLDEERRPWASVLVGEPGFLAAPDERRLRIEATPGFCDPLGTHLRVGSPVGLLGIEPHTRRRNRVNGTVTEIHGGGFTVEVEQSFGNCPQYIQAREPQWRDEPASHGAARPVFRHGTILGAEARELARKADTLFVASAARGARGHAGAAGVDVSHRGGRPGFIRLEERQGRTALTIPDFRGNNMFNTLGNVAAFPRAGLLFVDYDAGDVLQLTGAAEIVWDGPEVDAVPGAQRLLRVTVEEAIFAPRALPLRWSAPRFAPQLQDADSGAT